VSHSIRRILRGGSEKERDRKRERKGRSVQAGQLSPSMPEINKGLG